MNNTAKQQKQIPANKVSQQQENPSERYDGMFCNNFLKKCS